MIFLLATLLCAAAYGLRRWSENTIFTPDGRFYVAAGQGLEVPRPYCCRPLLPKLLGDSERAWRAMSATSLILCGPALVGYLIAHGATPWEALAGVGLFVGLSGVWRLGVRFPVLVDQTALLLSIAGAWAVLEGWWLSAVFLAILGGMTRETVPLWMAVFAWHPLPLIGLATPLWLIWKHRHTGIPEWFTGARRPLEQPIAAAREAHRGMWFNPRVMLYPWGAVGVLALLSLSQMPGWMIVALGVAIVLAYAQMFVATDVARLYQWAAPLAIAAALYSLPQALAPLVVVAHIFNPHQADI